jgi:hypothetical protein
MTVLMEFVAKSNSEVYQRCGDGSQLCFDAIFSSLQDMADQHNKWTPNVMQFFRMGQTKHVILAYTNSFGGGGAICRDFASGTFAI